MGEIGDRVNEETAKESDKSHKANEKTANEETGNESDESDEDLEDEERAHQSYVLTLPKSLIRCNTVLI